MTTAEVAGMLGTTSDIASKYLGRLASSGAIVGPACGVYVSPVMSVGSVGSVGIPDTPDGGTMRARGPTAEQWAEMARMADPALNTRAAGRPARMPGARAPLAGWLITLGRWLRLAIRARPGRY